MTLDVFRTLVPCFYGKVNKGMYFLVENVLMDLFEFEHYEEVMGRSHEFLQSVKMWKINNCSIESEDR